MAIQSQTLTHAARAGCRVLPLVSRVALTRRCADLLPPLPPLWRILLAVASMRARTHGVLPSSSDEEDEKKE